ncbi:MAG: ELWxxDGT repeat protein [Allosphingosinicella sp.]
MNAAPVIVPAPARLALFYGFHPDTGFDLWLTDGSAAGTVLVRQINPTTTASNVAHLTRLGDRMLFQANDGVNGAELWISDGTAAGTMLLKDINPGAGGSAPAEFARLGDKLLFQATNGTSGLELWITDGTAAGTTLLKDINAGTGGSAPGGFARLGDKLLFRASDGRDGTELWVTDGTAAGTVLVKDIVVGSVGSDPRDFALFGDSLLFRATDPTHGRELWITDGTAAGTKLLKDINPGSGNSDPFEFARLGDRMLFRAGDATRGTELWVTDGTTAGTVLLAEITPGPLGSGAAEFTQIGDRLVFRAHHDAAGFELWVTDGTAAGTMLLKDINPGTASSTPTALTRLGDKVLFHASDGTHGLELWVTDGTAAGTMLLKDIAPGAAGSRVAEFTRLGDTLLFRADDGVSGPELWITDGTAAGTRLLKDINPVWGSEPRNFGTLPATATYHAAGSPAAVAPLLALSDADGATLAGATVRIGAGFIAHADALTIGGLTAGTTGPGGAIAFSYAAATGIMTLSGTASLADYQAALRQVSFSSSSGNPGTRRTVAWTVNDGISSSLPADSTLYVTATNDPPVLTLADTDVAGTEDAPVPFGVASGNAISVADAQGGYLTVTLSVANGTLTLASQSGLSVTGDGTGTVRLQGLAADINAALDGLIYRGRLNYQGSDTLSVSVGDGSATRTGSIAITLADDGKIDGDAGDNVLTGTAGSDFFFVAQPGTETLSGLGGDDAFFFGAFLDPTDAVNGGAGNDQVAIQGDYSGGLTFGASLFVEVEVLALLSGLDTRFGDTAGNLYDYRLTSVDANVAAGARLTIDAAQLAAGEDFTFDGSAETDGSFYIYAGKGVDHLKGGAQLDVFLFRSDGRFTGDDRVDGGGGTDQLALRGVYSGANAVVMQAGTMTGIEVLAILSGQNAHYGPYLGDFSYDIVMHDGNVAAGAILYVDAAQLRPGETLTFDGSAERDGSYRIWGGTGADTITGGARGDTMTGGLGADRLSGGGGNDVFRYRFAAESAVGAEDRILDFSAGDRIDLSAIDANAGAGGDQAFTFIGSAAFAGTAGQLRAVNSGGTAWRVEGDIDGNGLADFAILVTRADAAAMAAIDFVL